MLKDEIELAQRSVRTDAYQMSIGEIVTMYRDGELIINPDFQRLFRWEIGQKSRFIESILLGIPLPPIFVFEMEDSKWELIDGLQRVSSILEFMGILKQPGSEQSAPPSILVSTTYLPSLNNTVWEKSERVREVPLQDQSEIGKEQKLAIRRARIGVEILKKPSDVNTKYDLFQRLNSGGTPANPQELRNCVVIMVSEPYYNFIGRLTEYEQFRKVMSITDDAIERRRDYEYVTRFLVHTYVPYDGKLDVEEYIDKGILQLAKQGPKRVQQSTFEGTFKLLFDAFGDDALRKIDHDRHVGRVGQVPFECIAIGIARNYRAITDSKNPVEYVQGRVRRFWRAKQLGEFTAPGLRGTVRIGKTIPFGERWFRP